MIWRNQRTAAEMEERETLQEVVWPPEPVVEEQQQFVRRFDL